MYGVAGLAALAVILVLAALSLGGGKPSAGDARSTLTDAGCTFRAAPALPGSHTVEQPGDTDKTWNTDPPTSGPHYVSRRRSSACTTSRSSNARVVHNLEHGGIFILYGDDVAGRRSSTQLRSFYDGSPDEDRAWRRCRGSATRSRSAPGCLDRTPSGKGDGLPREVRRRSTRTPSRRSSRAFQFQGPERFPRELASSRDVAVYTSSGRGGGTGETRPP